MTPLKKYKRFISNKYKITRFELTQSLTKSIRCLALMGAIMASAVCLADGRYIDAPGSSDHPMVSRFQGATLFRYGEINFERVEVKLPGGRTEVAEGRLFNYYYLGPKGKTDLEVFRNYKNALSTQGFQFLWLCEDTKLCSKQSLEEHAVRWTDDNRSFVGGKHYMNNMGGGKAFRFLMARLKRESGDITVIITLRSGYYSDVGFDTDYFMQIIESAELVDKQVTVSADALNQSLSKDGKVNLTGIFFDTAKTEMRPESKLQLDEMAKFLEKNLKLQVCIVGHTDNQGDLEANLNLSQKRAEGVMMALIKDYKINAARLSAKGLANYAPLGSNDNDKGRAKNRRVELVAM